MQAISIHFTCLKILARLISSETIRRHIKYIVYSLGEFIFSLKCHSKMPGIIEGFISKLNDYSECDELALILKNFQKIASVLEAIETALKMTDPNDPLSVNNLKQELNYFIKTLKKQKDRLLFSKSIDCIKSMIESLQISVIKNKLYNYIDSCINPIFERAEIISKNIDNDLFPSFFQSLYSETINPEKNTVNITNISNHILSNYQNVFNECLEEYKHQNINSLPNIDTVLCLFLKEFLLCYPEKEIQMLFIKISETNSRKIGSFSILHKIRNFRLYPPLIQCSLAQMLMEINNKKKRVCFMKYIMNVLKKKFAYEKIEENARIEYINQALKSPFVEILKHFYDSEIPLEEILDNATKNIYLFQFPENHFGFTSKNQHISIHLFSQGLVKKGAIFIVLLHELAHYLKRVNCQTVEEAIIRKSFEPNHEGGRNLEVLLFGHTIHLLTEAASTFLLKDPLPQTLEGFQKQFDFENNIADGSNKKFVTLSGSGEVVLLRYCACSYSSGPGPGSDS